MSDHIERLREMLARATPGARMRPISMRGEALLELGDPYNKPCSSRSIQLSEADAALIVAMRNAFPALLAVAEAAKNHERVRQRCGPFDEYEATRKVLQDALANLEKLTNNPH